MILRSRRDHQVLIATAVCAIGVPSALASWVVARTCALADHLGAAGGVVARIGAVDVDLTGTIQLTDVGLGAQVSADAISASVGLDSLLAGTLRADEIRVDGPRVAIQVDADGDSDVARLARRLASASRPPAGATADPSVAAGRLRRIVVSSGSLSARVAGLGELAADGVELVPDADGVRVITGAIRINGQASPLGVELAFARSAAELSLPHLRFGRVLAVGGVGAITADPGPGAAGEASLARRLPLRDVAIGRLADGGALELRAIVDDGGIPRPLAIDVQPRGLAISVRGDRIPLRAFATVVPHGIELDAAHASGSVVVRRDAAHFVVDVDGTIDRVSLDHRTLAPIAVPLAAVVHASIAVSPEAITVPRAAIELGAAHLSVTGWVRRGQPISGQVDVSLATTACGDLLAALPAELRGPLDGMVLGGVIGGHVRVAVDLAAPPGEGVDLLASITDGCRSDAEPPGADVARLAAATDQVFADGSHARVGMGEPGWAPLPQVPSHVSGAFVSAEDARFYEHAGFDLNQIAKSLEIDLREHRLARGGSTISQQLVKNAFLTQRRSFDRKLQEAILTWRLEARLGKKQILERYLNIIELGPRVFGLAAAARHWFDAAPRELSIRQAAFLAALTSEPSSMSRRVRRAGGLDPDSAVRVDVVLRAMWRDGVIDGEQFESARAQTLRFAPAALKQER